MLAFLLKFFTSKISGFVIVISAVTLGLSLYHKGLISPDKLAIFLVLIVIGAAINSVLVKVLLALSGLIFLLLDLTQYDLPQFRDALMAAGALLMALFGLYIIMKAFSNKNRP